MSELLKTNEIPSIYGTLRVEEKIIQRIWAEQNFIDSELRTECGLPLKILSPGKWNLSEEGPDFKNASLMINGTKKHGDIEIHFNTKEWYDHGHHLDPNYNRVVLHITLFPSKPNEKKCRNKLGSQIAQFVLLPILKESIEEIIEGYAFESLVNSESNIFQNFQSSRILSEIRRDHVHFAKQRWLAKRKFAQNRLKKQSIEEAFHEIFMEVLGYKRNKVQMSNLAKIFLPSFWKEENGQVDEIYNRINYWKIRGLRPANHPKQRIKQYLQLWKSSPDWIDKLLALEIPDQKIIEHSTRKSLGLPSLNKKWKSALNNTIGGTRVNTLWVDACLPLLSEINNKDYFTTWYYWYPGDMPQLLKNLAQKAAVSGHEKKNPYSNGSLQGIFGYCIKNNFLE